MRPGSYTVRPLSSLDALIWPRSVARTAPCSIGRTYDFPVRSSFTTRRSFAMARMLARRGGLGKCLRGRDGEDDYGRGDARGRSAGAPAGGPMAAARLT